MFFVFHESAGKNNDDDDNNNNSNNNNNMIEMGSFTPLVFGTNGGMGNECQRFLKHLADKIPQNVLLNFRLEFPKSDPTIYLPSRISEIFRQMVSTPCLHRNRF